MKNSERRQNHTPCLARSAPNRGRVLGTMRMMIVLFGMVVLVSGCHFMMETGRRLWGSSTAALEAAKEKGVVMVMSCPYDVAYDYILSLARRHWEQAPLMASERLHHKSSYAQEQRSVPASGSIPLHIKEVDLSSIGPQPFVLFQQRRNEGVIVLMDVPNSVNTTEVGVFLSSIDDNATQVVISSLSTLARDVTAGILVQRLPDSCSLVSYKELDRHHEVVP